MRRRQLRDDIVNHKQAHVFRGMNRGHKLIVELIREQGIGQLAKVELQHAGHGVNVRRVNVVQQIGHLIRVKLQAQALNVGVDAGESVDPIDCSMFLRIEQEASCNNAAQTSSIIIQRRGGCHNRA